MAIGLIAGIWLFFRDAPYGRFTKTSWGPMISNRLGWFLMEGTALAAFALNLLLPRAAAQTTLPSSPAMSPHSTFHWLSPAGVMAALYMLHYIHRGLIYPW